MDRTFNTFLKGDKNGRTMRSDFYFFLNFFCKSLKTIALFTQLNNPKRFMKKLISWFPRNTPHVLDTHHVVQIPRLTVALEWHSHWTV